jgi:hypothetical protein
LALLATFGVKGERSLRAVGQAEVSTMA